MKAVSWADATRSTEGAQRAEEVASVVMAKGSLGLRFRPQIGGNSASMPLASRKQNGPRERPIIHENENE
jgi:hypothetical protein